MDFKSGHASYQLCDLRHILPAVGLGFHLSKMEVIVAIFLRAVGRRPWHTLGTQCRLPPYPLHLLPSES